MALDTSTISVSAPGSIMVMGEHAVLFGHRAIACAVDKYIHVDLTPRDDDQVIIDSALAEYCGSLNALHDDQRIRFVLAAIAHFQPALPSGLTLKITAGFSHTVGLGSSAAVTAAVVKALAIYSGQPDTPEAIFTAALAVVHKVQGRGSGTDLAASIYGGLIAYTVEPREVCPLPGLPPISLFYVGYKTTTPEVLSVVAQRSEQHPALYEQIYQLMDKTSCEAEAAIKQQDWPALGRLMNIYQGLMDALGVTDANLAQLVYQLRSSTSINGAKISGSGLGDCVIALGQDSHLDVPFESIPVNISAKGTVRVN